MPSRIDEAGHTKAFGLVERALYGPNDDRPIFYQNLAHDIAEFDNNSMILCGDWNLVMEQEKDTENYLHMNNPNAKRAVDTIIADFSLYDVWRMHHEELRKYTYRQYHPRKQSRLDFFLVSEDLFEVMTGSQIKCGYRTDHSLIGLDLIARYKRGKSYWKFNAALLTDQDYINTVKQIVWETVEMYATISYNRQHLNNVSLDALQWSISDQLFL